MIKRFAATVGFCILVAMVARTVFGVTIDYSEK